jgi:hypothetical protein
MSLVGHTLVAPVVLTRSFLSLCSTRFSRAVQCGCVIYDAITLVYRAVPNGRSSCGRGARHEIGALPG